jgi:hypothetical protein
MRKSLPAGVAALLVLLGALVWVAVAPPLPCPVTEGAYDRIEEGMSRAQVEGLLGGPPGDYRTKPGLVPLAIPGLADRGVPEVWWGDQGFVVVLFGGTDRVREKSFHRLSATEAGPIETLRWRLARRWHALWGR